MKCPKCNRVLILKYVMDPDGTFRVVWYCKDCKHEIFAVQRRC